MVEGGHLVVTTKSAEGSCATNNKNSIAAKRPAMGKDRPKQIIAQI